MSQGLYLAATTFMVVTAGMHSYFGETRLIQPMLASDAPIMRSGLARGVMRGAWHLTTLYMLLSAVVVWRAAMAPASADRVVLCATGAAWIAAGLFSLIRSRGRHIGWPPLLLSGLCTLAPLV